MSKGGNKVIIGWLMGGQSTPGFVASIAALTAITPQYGVELLGAIPKVSGPRIAAARNTLVEHFLNTPADWLFMVDDDMVFDSDALVRLLETADPDERPVVGGFAYAAGRDGYFSTIWTLNEDNQPVRVDDYPSGEVIRVVGTGAACLLVHRKVFEKIRESYGESPWVWFQESSFDGRTVGEDFTFCVRVQEAGFPIHVDTGVEFGHEKLVNVDRKFVENWRRTHRVVITGTGRCGTGYMAHLFTHSAIPATHEAVYAPDGGDWEWQRIEASWMAAPHLNTFDGHVVHLVRHPLDVINSLVGIEFWTNPVHDEYQTYAETHLPTVLEYDDPVEKSMVWWVEWNRLIEPYADQRIRVEDVTPEDLSVIAAEAGARHSPSDMLPALHRIPTTVNHRPRADLTWDDLPTGDTKTELETLAKEYGYDL